MTPHRQEAKILQESDLAAAVTAEGIGPNDLQTFVLRGADLQQAAYQPGDWLEPKDGSAQRMMIVGMNQISAIELPPLF